MSFYYHPSIGTFHLQDVKRPRVVPGHQRHKWSQKVRRRGDIATCLQCGCQYLYMANYEIVYQMPGQHQQTERPPCTGPAAPAAPPQLPLSATTASPDAAPATPAPPIPPGLPITYTEPAPYNRHD